MVTEIRSKFYSVAPSLLMEPTLSKSTTMAADVGLKYNATLRVGPWTQNFVLTIYVYMKAVNHLFLFLFFSNPVLEQVYIWHDRRQIGLSNFMKNDALDRSFMFNPHPLGLMYKARVLVIYPVIRQAFLVYCFSHLVLCLR